MSIQYYCFQHSCVLFLPIYNAVLEIYCMKYLKCQRFKLRWVILLCKCKYSVHKNEGEYEYMHYLIPSKTKYIIFIMIVLVFCKHILNGKSALLVLYGISFGSGSDFWRCQLDHLSFTYLWITISAAPDGNQWVEIIFSRKVYVMSVLWLMNHQWQQIEKKFNQS